MIDDCTSCDAEDPRAEALVVAELPQATLHPEKDILEDVVDVGGRWHPPSDEGPKLVLEGDPASACRGMDHD
jgi:hypothetical protein